MKYNYLILKLGPSYKNNESLLNKKAAEGWELVSVAPYPKVNNAGETVVEMQAFLKSSAKKKNVING